jgi:general secretion pathway protein A
MYENHYNLKVMPFQITTDPRFLWLGEKHSEALATLKYGILENKGFLLLTGDIGTGKTALINRLVKMIDVAAIVAKVPDPGLSSLDFFNFLSVEFKMNKKFDSKGAFLIQLKQFLHKAYSAKKKVLLIVDEAQRLNHELLEQIRLLSNIELQNRKLINIFFVGQTEFGEMLMEERNRAVRQRISVSYHIEPLTETEARYYIKHRLKIAGATHEIFSKDAVRAIFSFSAGYPRLINIICDHALLTGYASGLNSIDKNVIQECERELKIPLDIGIENGNGRKKSAAHRNNSTDLLPEKPSSIKRTGVLVAIIMLVVFGIYFFISQKSADDPRWSMEEIAPQRYKGALPQEAEIPASPGLQVHELKNVEPIKETPLSDHSVRKQIQSPENDNALNTTNRQQPVEKDTAGKKLRQPVQSDDGPKKTALNKTQEVAPFPERKIIIYFKHNSNELPDQSFDMLNRISNFMLNRPSATIEIKGYTDSTGSYSYNVSVSEFRANTIKIFLLGKGIDSSRIKTAGLGPKNPIATNKTEEGRRKNRRVELELNFNSPGE